jgi:hypothetical protein
MATNKQKESIIELYSAYFNRAADADGANFWEKSYDIFLAQAPNSASAEEFALTKISSQMATSPEYIALYPAELLNVTFLENVYLNLFDRIIDEGGKEFWLKHLNAGTMSKDTAIVNLIAGAKANTSPQGLSDKAFLANKTTISLYFVEVIESNDLKLATLAFKKITSDPATIQPVKDELDSGEIIISSTTTEPPPVIPTPQPDPVIPAPTNPPANNDASAPALTSISAKDGTYSVLETVSITLTYNEIVFVDRSFGSPTLTLSNGKLATYSSGSGHEKLIFNYQVQNGDTNSSDLDVLSINLNKATIKDKAENSAGFALGTGIDLKTNASVVIKGIPAPTISSINNPAVDENIGENQVVYTVTSDDTAATYSLKFGEDSSAFTINGNTGAVTLATNPDFEVKPSYQFTVIASDTTGNTTEQAITLGINDIDEVKPNITSSETATAINENSAAGQIIYTVIATDDSKITYSLKTVDNSIAFTIDGNSGEVTLIGIPDYETTSSYKFTVVATDVKGNASEKAVTLAVNNLEEDAPKATLTYSTDTNSTIVPAASTIAVKDTDTLRIFATFNETVQDSPLPTIAIDNGILSAVNMTKESSTVYYYDLNVPIGDKIGTVTIANAKDTVGNVITDAPTNATFSIDNTVLAPTFTLNLDSGSDSSDGITNDATVNVTLASDVASWEYNLKDSGWVAGTSTSFELVDNTTYASGDIQVRQTDVVGNVSEITNNANEIKIETAAPSTTISNIDISADTGIATDFITKTVSQTITATLSTNLVTGEVLYGSIDDGANWINVTSKASGTAISWDGATLSGNSNIKFKVTDAAGNDGSIASQSYELDTTSPSTTISNIDISDDTGTLATDFITKTASQTITATLSTTLATGEILYGSIDDGSNWVNVTNKATGTTITWDGATLSSSSNIKFKVTDAAGNDGSIANQSYELDTIIPTISSVTITDGTYNVGDAATITITAGGTETGLTLSTATFNGETLTGITDNNNGTYSATYTVVEGDTDVADGNNVVTNLILTDAAGNASTATTAVTLNGESIDGNGRETVIFDLVNGKSSAGSTNNRTFDINVDYDIYIVIPVAGGTTAYNGGGTWNSANTWSGATTLLADATSGDKIRFVFESTATIEQKLSNGNNVTLADHRQGHKTTSSSMYTGEGTSWNSGVDLATSNALMYLKTTGQIREYNETEMTTSPTSSNAVIADLWDSFSTAAIDAAKQGYFLDTVNQVIGTVGDIVGLQNIYDNL